MTTVLVAALVAVVSYVVSSEVVHHRASLGFQLTSGTGFSITSSVDATYTAASGTCSGTSASLYPGTPRCLDLVVTNPLRAPLTVTNLTVTGVALSQSTTTHPSCAPTSATFTFAETDFSGVLPVDAETTASVGRPLAWKSNGTTQDPCAGATFSFTYTGTAAFTDATTTTITAIPDTQTPGEPVVLNVAVTGENPAVDTHTPTGTVKLYLFTSTCSTRDASTFASASVSGGSAHLSTSTLPVGTDCIQAVYEDAGADFSASTSGIVHVRIGSTSTKVKTTTVLTLPPDPSTAGLPVVFTATVTGVSGNPTGSVDFFLCASQTNPTTCTTEVGTASIDPSTHEASFEYDFTGAGTHYVEARYLGTSRFTASASLIATETLTSVGTTASLSSSPDPSFLGQVVTLAATLKTTSGVGTPTGTVTFSLCNTASCQTTTALGTKSLSGGKATISVPTPPAGTDHLYASYTGSSTFEASRTSDLTQNVLAPPSVCASGGYTNYVEGYSGSSDSSYFANHGLFGTFPVVIGTNGNDFIYLPAGTFVANGLNGNDCVSAGAGADWLFEGTGNDGIEAGNGTDQVIAGNGSDKVHFGTGSGDAVTLGNGTDTVTVGNGRDDQVTTGNGTGDTLEAGNGTDDVVEAGSGSHDSVIVGRGSDTVRVGNGNADQVVLGSGTDTLVVGNGSNLTVTAGNGNDTVTVGKGSKNKLSVGSGRDTVDLGGGSKNTVELGSGTDTVVLEGSSDTITGGSGAERIYLGAGTRNTFSGTSRTKDTCYVPEPPPSYRGPTPAGYYDDTVIKCKMAQAS